MSSVMQFAAVVLEEPSVKMDSSTVVAHICQNKNTQNFKFFSLACCRPLVEQHPLFHNVSACIC
jgi:hypothetical protein